VYPALSILQTLKHNQEQAHASGAPLLQDDVLWVGSQDGLEVNLVQRAGIPFEAIPAAGVHGVGLRALPANLTRLLRGFFAASRLLADYKPDVLLFTGGYVAIPMALAARSPLRRTPRPSIFLYVPDIEPGMALKALARFADCIAITAPESRHFFSARANTVVTGYPVRPDLAGRQKEHARRSLNLAEDLPVVLVFGGSLGARSINRALFPVLAKLLEKAQVLHLSGNLDWDETQAHARSLQHSHPQLAARYHAFPYLHEDMADALCAADLSVCRAGASTLGELPAVGLPAILVPYPFAWRYQQVNAEYLHKHGAAEIVPNDDLPARLLPLVTELIENREKRLRMSTAMHSLAAPNAAQLILDWMKRISPSQASLQG